MVFMSHLTKTILTVGALVVATIIVACWGNGRGLGSEFEVAHESPIFQNISRAAFMHQTHGGGFVVNFSTLESYHRNPEGDQFLLVSFASESGRLVSQVVAESTEARSYAYSETLRKYVLGASLDPQIFLYDPMSHSVKPIFLGPRTGVWIHGLAAKGDYVYTIMSASSSVPREFNGILKVNLHTGDFNVIPFLDRGTQTYGGVQTVDPAGRVWFYRAYPFAQMWYDTKFGMRNRVVSGYEDWSIESWDTWQGDTFLVLTKPDGTFIKRRVDLKDMKVLEENSQEPFSDNTDVFLRSIPVDLYHGGGPSVESLYFDPRTMEFYRRNRDNDTMKLLGSFALGKIEVMGFHESPQETSTHWIHPEYGEIDVLGATSSDDLVIWLRGRKTYAILDFTRGDLVLHDIDIRNLSPADITSLVVGRDGMLYGGGYLTMTDLFRFNTMTNASQVLPGAIPNAEGQINSMFVGLDAKIYGAGYPDSVIFRYDPLAPWNPGRITGSNPVNLGPMRHHRQTRAFRGLQALDGTIWYQSVTDYEVPIAHALARADFDGLKLEVKTDLDDGIPEVSDLAVLDRDHLILLGRKNGDGALYVLNQHDFLIEREAGLDQVGGVLVNLDPYDPTVSRLFLAQGGDLFRVLPDLSRQLVHRSPKPIVRILSGDGDDMVLVGKTIIEKINLRSGSSVMWWSGMDKLGGSVFGNLTWSPVVFHDGSLFIGNEEKLLRFSPAKDVMR